MGLLDALKKAKDQKQGGEAAHTNQSDVLPAAPSSAQSIFSKLKQELSSEQSKKEAQQVAVNKILDAIDDVPTLPTIVNKVIQSLNNPQTTAKEISDIVRNDPSITAKILKIGNSAYYAGYSPCGNVQNAIARIGLIQMKRTIFSVSVFDSFNKLPHGSFNLKDFWTHSIAVGYAAKLIGKLSKFRDSDDLYTAGLLHDLGKLITLRYIPEMFETIWKKLQESESGVYYDIERSEFPISHCEIGSWLAVKWNMSREIQAVIFNHHQPPIKSTVFEKDIIMFSAIVYLADKFVKKLEFGNSGDRDSNIDMEIFNFVFRESATQEKISEEILKIKTVIDATAEAL
ncbi:MAG TPA: HDOD domain-containing protein [Candidatus Wallbacteria bacterium]|nr:HDOD domain-containing protein [Candidatus Wallbacteria bacterium]